MSTSSRWKGLPIVLFLLLGCDGNAPADRTAELAAIPSALHPYAGFWKSDPKDNFGLAIAPATEGYYSISFCGPGGCFKPGTYRPNSRIEGDPNYQIVNVNTIKVSTSSGFDTYFRVTSR